MSFCCLHGETSHFYFVGGFDFYQKNNEVLESDLFESNGHLIASACPIGLTVVIP